MSNTSNSTVQTKYFDLHIVGLGYLNRARWVKLDRGNAFLAVDVAAIHGKADAIQHTRFDCRVSGSEAKRVVEQYLPLINDKSHKVLVSFRLGDLYSDTFTFKDGDKAGQTGVSLKARLLRLNWVRIDGDSVYTASIQDDEEQLPQTAETVAGDQPNVDSKDSDLTDQLPSEVELSKLDPEFEAKKNRLKDLGYRFDNQRKLWHLPKSHTAA
jgi:hypothetical protein